MKNTSLKILFLTIFTIIISCNSREETTQDTQNETPAALQDKSFDLKRYKSRDVDLVSLLYKDLVEKSAELQGLENDIENLNSNDSLDEYYKYDIKSKDYYLSSLNISEEINDSVLKNKVIALIEKSKINYSAKTKELNEIMSKIKDKNKSIDDYHNVLKIVLTLPIIEKYQLQNLPKEEKYIKVIKKQDSIIEKTKTLIPN